MLELGLGDFLRVGHLRQLYRVRGSEADFWWMGDKTAYSVGDRIGFLGSVISRIDFVPYEKWAERNRILINKDYSSSSHSGRRHMLFQEIELIDLGNQILPNHYQLGGRNLEFLNLDNLIVQSPMINTPTNIYYSSIRGMIIKGGIAFLRFYKSHAYDYSSFNGMMITNGRVQQCFFQNCHINLELEMAELKMCEFINSDIDFSMRDSFLRDSVFRYDPQSGYSYFLAYQAHKRAYTIYANQRDFREAGKHYFLMKKNERSTHIRPRIALRPGVFGADQARRPPSIWKRIGSIIRGLSLYFQEVYWGYGERPSRIFAAIPLFVAFFSALFYLDPNSKTHSNLAMSVYFSLGTFSTMTFGHISQESTFLNFATSLEAILGITNFGMLVSGFSAKLRQL